VLRVDLERRQLAGRVRDRLVPPDVAPGLHRRAFPAPPPHHDVLDRRRDRQSLVDERLHRHFAAAPQRRIRRHDHLRLGVLKPGRDRGRREPREDRHLDRPQVRARV
jgi:hypothetical protein